MSNPQPPRTQSADLDHTGLRWSLVIFFLLLLFGLIGYGIRGIIPPTDVREVDASYRNHLIRSKF